MTEIPILTGISQETMQDLETPSPKTLVLVSAQNVMALMDASTKDELFLTPTSARDLVPNTEGTVATIKSIEITMHRHYHQAGPFREEHEAAVAHVQLKGKGKGRLSEVTDRFQELPTAGEVKEIPNGFKAF